MLNRTIQVLTFSLLLTISAVGANAGASSSARTMSLSVTDAESNPVAGAVVWFAAATDSDRPAANADIVLVDQIDKQFIPQLTVIRTGTVVEFPNSDSVSHHVYSFAQPNSFELPLYRGGETPRIRFDHAGIVTLGCNIHDAMLGYIVVLDEADFAITNQDGVALFTRLPAAAVDIQIWSPYLNATKPVRAERIGSADTQLSVRVPLRLQPQPGVGESSLAWEDY